MSEQDRLVARINAMPRPSEREMARLDAALDGQPCIGAIGDWRREYSYRFDVAAFDRDRSLRAVRDVVEFKLIDGRRDAGDTRHVAKPPGSAANIVEFIRTASGQMRLSTGKLTIDYCGAA